jgi:uncharacterized protein (TIGR01568 family)
MLHTPTQQTILFSLNAHMTDPTKIQYIHLSFFFKDSSFSLFLPLHYFNNTSLVPRLTHTPHMGKGLKSLLSCKYPKTSSFRAGTGNGTCTTDSDAIYKTMNSMYLDNAYSEEEIEIDTEAEAEPETTSSIDDSGEFLIVHQIHSDRLFFEPNSTSCSILEKTQKDHKNLKEEMTEESSVPFKESFLMAMESTDPYADFRISMEEMVAAHGLTDWNRLEELLVWYLRVNGKKNHAFIIQAFVDLLAGLVPVVGLSSEESSSSSCITSSCITFDEVEGSES